MFLNLATKARTIRRYNRERIITDDDVGYIIRCASICASAGNLQRLRYGFIGNQSSLDAFSKISLGGYLKESEKPTENVAPVGYIVIASFSEEPDPNLLIDAGIAAESIVLVLSPRPA